LPDHGIRAGQVGTIVHIHTRPNVAYEVEFADDDGETLAMVTLLESQINVSWRMPQVLKAA
jgi:hypothetical protein